MKPTDYLHENPRIICLVEDDDSIRELLVFNLESEGYDVR